MGNSLLNDCELQQGARRRQAKIFTEVGRNQSGSAAPSQMQLNSNKTGQIKRNLSLNTTDGRSEHKPKRFLSLSKAVQSQTNILANSNCRKGIAITTNEQSSVRMSVERFINYDSKHGQAVKRQPIKKQSIKKMSIKPRDLPRYSSQKIIPPSLNQIATQITPNEIKPRECKMSATYLLSQPNIIINYPPPAHQIRPINISAQSYAAPVAPRYTAPNGHPSQPSESNGKKLRKVALSKSYVRHADSQPLNSFTDYAGNQENSFAGKQDQSKRNISGLDNQQEQVGLKIYQASAIKRLQQKQNHAVLTDPNLMTYIKHHQPPKRFKQAHSRYALAQQQNGSIQKSLSLQHLNCTSSIVQQKYPPNVWLSKERLETKVENQVQSKQLLEQKEVESKVVIEQSFRFQTATDISYEERSDNTSFVPITNRARANLSNGSSQNYLDEVLAQCKPRLNEKVLADLLRLPLKH